MIYLSGATPLLLTTMQESRPIGIGFMLGFNKGSRLDMSGWPWAADNGCFTQPEKYSDAAFLVWLGRRCPTHCLFAVAPDVVGDARATWERSQPMLARIRDAGYPVALAAQNGWDAGAVDWDAFDCLFLGGDDAFKLGPDGRRAVTDGLAHGKHVHMGRVNSYTRLAYAAGLGCHSADGTTVAYNPARYVTEIKRWVARLNAPQLPLWEE